jgi:hypothetical protein
MNEELQTNELTFQKIFTVIKRSFVRILIYALVLAILGGGITAIITVASRGSAEYTTIIEYNYSGVENGKDPLDNMLDTNRIKSPLVVNNALKNMGITDNNVISAYSQILIDNISIVGYVSDRTAKELQTNESLKYFPTRYVITLIENDDLHFSDTHYLNFLNEMVKSYKQYFKDAYNYGNVLSLSIADDALEASSDYYDLCADYNLAINGLLTEMGILKDKVPDRYNKLYSNIEILKNELSTIERYIIGKNVSKVNAPMTLDQNLQSKITNYEDLSTQYADLALAQFNAIEAYDNSSSQIISDGKLVDIVLSESKHYDDMLKKYNDYITKQHNYVYQQQLVSAQKTAIGIGQTTVEDRANVENSLLAFDNNLKNTLNSVNSELKLYSEQRVTESGVNVAMSAAKNQTISYTLIIIVAIVCGFIGIIVAIIITEIRVRKNEKKLAKSPLETSAE